MEIVSAHRCDIGRTHSQNDDYVWVDEAANIFIVADGMGGQEAGNVASRMTAETVGAMLAREMRTAPQLAAEDITKIMVEAIETANRDVFSAAQKAEQKRKMGTTIVAVVVKADVVTISHAGDSRAYLLRGQTLQQLTEDDSWGAQFAAAGVENKKNGEKGRFDHFLTKSIGQGSEIDPSLLTVYVQPNDWLLLCSDGLWNMVDDAQILRVLLNAGDNPQAAVDTLVSAANAAGGKDNISVIALKFLN